MNIEKHSPLHTNTPLFKITVKDLDLYAHSYKNPLKPPLHQKYHHTFYSQSQIIDFVSKKLGTPPLTTTTKPLQNPKRGPTPLDFDDFRTLDRSNLKPPLTPKYYRNQELSYHFSDILK